MIQDWLGVDAGHVLALVGEQLLLAVVPALVALVLALPIGYLVSRHRATAHAVLAVFGLLYTVPALALFVAMPVILGTRLLDPVNVAVALTVYSVLRLVRSVVVGVRSIPDAVTRSASALGYGRLRRYLLVELPLTMPAVLRGLRVVVVANLVLVTVAGVIGLGALGELFGLGLAQPAYAPVLVGLGLTVALALLADGLIVLLQRGTMPWSQVGRAG